MFFLTNFSVQPFGINQREAIFPLQLLIAIYSLSFTNHRTRCVVVTLSHVKFPICKMRRIGIDHLCCYSRETILSDMYGSKDSNMFYRKIFRVNTILASEPLQSWLCSAVSLLLRAVRLDRMQQPALV